MRPGGQREKGKAFERKVAAILRERWPEALVRRASQAERAYNPDVFVEDGPRILQRLWMELQDSSQPTPCAKLEQARHDVDEDPRHYDRGEHRLPVAITHELGARSIIATMRLDDLMDIAAPDRIHVEERALVTMELDEFLDLLAFKASARESEAA